MGCHFLTQNIQLGAAGYGGAATKVDFDVQLRGHQLERF